jgi:glucosylglycerol-phosphate synthase
MLLATDLDGTFLGGLAEHRQNLYQLIAGSQDIQLVFVTGRGLEAVMPLLSDPAVPVPDYIICDVGGTVVEGGSLQPVQPLQADIDLHWPGEHKVSEAMRPFTILERQDVPQQRRCSYFCHSDAVTPELAGVAKSLGCEVLYSASRYLDILPAGVNKGSTLTALIAHLGVDPEQVLVAGDTLNDLSMYEAGFKGVCVGESEPGLLQATKGEARVLQATDAGCGGILQAIIHFGLLAPGYVHLPTEAAAMGGAELVMVYHRLPYEEHHINGQIVQRRPKSPNGIIPSLLSFFASGKRGSWVAWSIHDEAKDPPFEVHTTVDARAYPGLVAARVPLSEEEVEVFYKRFSKEAFWPTLHTFWERAIFREEDWTVFLAVNRKFAETTAAEAAHGATVWLHDYNLWMVPAALRELRPDLKIAFFHHTYFPSADVFNVLPWRREIVGSLLQCDYIGFHIPRQAENFVDVARGVAPIDIIERKGCTPRFLSYGCAVGLETMSTLIEVHGRRIGLGAHPVGLDLGRIRQALANPKTPGRRQAIRNEFAGKQIILSVERLDYTKGTLEKIRAFGDLLARSPMLRGKVSLVVVCVPAAKEMTIYDELQVQIEQAVGRVNGEYADVGWTPIRFFFRPLPFDEVVAWYAEAGVMWITPLRDGLNLVGKEYAATQGQSDGRGVLVLSEFAGSAAELHGAILTNPHDPVDLRERLLQAIEMDPVERDSRLRRLYDIVEHNDIDRWGREFLDAVAAVADAGT